MKRTATTGTRVARGLRRYARVWVTAAVIATASVFVTATPGMLDPTFNATGIVRSIRGFATSVVIDHLGRIIVAGGSEYPNFLIARYNTNGASLDLTFGDAGVVVSQIAGIYRIDDVAVDAVGRILVIGSTDAEGGDNDFAIARFNTNGALDVTFNGTGYTIVGFDGQDYPSSILIDAVGRIVVAGSSLNGCLFCDYNSDFAMLRLLPNGDLDPSFDGDGKLLTRFGDWEEIHGIAIDTLGRIVAVGAIDSANSGARTRQRVAMARYLEDGSLDTTFDSDGKASSTFGGGWNAATSIAIDSRGGILIGGFRADFRHIEPPFALSYNATADFVLARYQDDGSADPSFGDGGMAVTDFAGWDDFANAVTIDAAGRILLAGSSYTATTNDDFAVARYSNNGVLDPHFGASGLTRTAFPDLDGARSVDWASGIVLDSEGRILLAGGSRPSDTFVALARYQPDRPDFSLNPIPTITVTPGGTGSTTVTVNSIDGFALPLQFDLYGTQTGGVLPAGVAAPGVSVTPVPYESVSATLQVNISAAVAPTTFNLWLIDTAFVDHATRVRVNVVSTAQSTAGAVATFTDAALIQSGVAGALTAKLDAAQAHIAASQTLPAVNTLSAFINQVEAQSGKQIATSATLDGVTFNPAAVLIAQARGVIAYLATEGSAAPLMGYVINAAQSAVRAATVAIVDSSNAVVATAVTDATGFYFFAATNEWRLGSTYVAKVTGLPAGFTTATPSAQTFAWEGTAGLLDHFVLK